MFKIIKNVTYCTWIGACCLMACQKQIAERPVKIIAHRAMHLEYPENSIPAIQAAIDIGIDYVEVDIRTTADGKLALMHNRMIDNTTTGHGKLDELSYEQIIQFDLKNHLGEVSAGEKVPLLTDALARMQGKIGIYADVKAAATLDVLDALRQFDMIGSAVIYSDDDQLSEFQQLEPAIAVMPEVDSQADLERAVDRFHPKVVAMVWRGFSEDLVTKIHDVGPMVYLDILGAGDTPDGVRRTIAAGVDAVQTNNPAMVLKVIREMGE